jgi:GAF domain-containing protein
MTTAIPPAAPQTQPAKNQSPTRFVDLLVQPAVSVTLKEDRQQARLLAFFLLILSLLTIMGTILPPVFGMENPLDDPFTLLMGGSAVVILAAYGLSRTRRFRLGAVLTAGVLSGLPFALSLTRHDFDPARVPSVFGWLLLALLFGSIFFNMWGVVLLTLANTATLIAFPFVAPEVTHQMLFPPVSLLIVVGVLLAVSAGNRNFIERVRLADLSEKNKELEILQGSLENRVRSRTEDLERRLVQLRTSAEISRSISGVLDLDDLLDQVVNLLRERFDLYYAGVFLIDEATGYAVLNSGTGEAGRRMLAEEHRLAVGGPSMIGWATAHQKPRIALDLGQEAVHFENPHLPLTRTEMALPLIAGEEVLGAVTIQSSEAEAFDQDDITVLQGIADTLATAITNARLFARVQESLQEIESLQSNYLSQAWSQVNPEGWSFSLKGPNDGEAPGKETADIHVPLTLREQVIGQITLEADKGGWSTEETAFIEAITTQAAIALENARLLEESQHRADRERIISDISSKLWRSTDVDTILQTSLRELGKALNASEGFIQLEVED